MPISSDDIQLIAPAPGAVLGTSAQIVGPPGLATFFYWWVAHYPIGVTVISVPLLVRAAPSPLTATNYVRVTGQAVLGATSYDLLRTAAPSLPSGTANIALATALTSPTFNDQGAALTAYNVAGLAAGAPVSEFINLNNRDYAQPTLVFSPWPQAVQGLIFPDGSTQTSSATAVGRVMSWKPYTVTLVGPNWQITGPDGTVTTIPRAASTTQNILLATMPPNGYVIDARIFNTAGPSGGVTSAVIGGLGSFMGGVPNSEIFCSFNFNLQSTPSSGNFTDVSTTPGNVAVNVPVGLIANITTGPGNVNAMTGPCSFVVSVLWGVTS